MIGKNVVPRRLRRRRSRARVRRTWRRASTRRPARRNAAGDIPVAQTHVSAIRTLGVALGIPEDLLNTSFTASAGGKVVQAAVIV